MANERQELEALRALKAARQAGDAQAAQQAAAAVQAARVGIGEAVARGTAKTALDNLLGVPQGIGTALASGAAALDTLGQVGGALVRGEPLDIADRFRAARARQEQLQPAAGLLALPRVSAEQAAGVTGALLRGGNVGERIAEQEAETARFAEQRPIATAVGGLLGDALTIAATRGLAGGQVGVASTVETAVPRAADLLGRALQTSARFLGRTAQRAARTGAELAALEALKGGDPVQVGLVAAGVQSAGESALSVLRGIKRFGLTKALVGASVVGIIGQETVPGGFQIVEQTIKDRGKEIGIALVLSGAAALPALRRSEFAAFSRNPAFVEIASNLNRAGLLKIIEGARRDPANVVPVAQQFAADPDFFGPEARQRLERAFAGDEAPDRAIAELLADETFRERFEAIGTGADPARQDIEGAIRADTRGRPPLKAADVAQALARRLPARARQKFERSRPRTFIAEIVRDGETFGQVFPRLGTGQQSQVLEANLNQLLAASVRAENGRTVVDGARLRRAWQRLPEAARNAYPAKTRSRIETFIERASARTLAGLPPDIARALMIDGELARQLDMGER